MTAGVGASERLGRDSRSARIGCWSLDQRVHAIIFSDDAEGVRGFFRDVLELPSVDAGGGWLIFALPPAELAAHPDGGESRHELYLMCDDIGTTVDELKAKGVEFTREISDEGFGLMTALRLPDGGELAIYEPRHPSPLSPER